MILSRKIVRSCIAVVIASLVFSGALFAGEELLIPILRGEGNAAVILSPGDGTAVLIDGGRAGEGNTAMTTEGESILESLWRRGYRQLVVLCSHSHVDHAGALRRVVGAVAKGPDEVDLTRFTRVLLVDSAYPTEKSLRAVSVAAHGERENIRYVEATRKNLSELAEFEGFLGTASRVSFRTLPYSPTEAAPVHGHSIVTETTIRKDGHTLKFLDPDDASDAAIAEALRKRGPMEEGATLLLSAPHHGSRFSKLAIFAEHGWRPSAIVFQANRKNQYRHPHTATWRQAVEMVGLESVFVTGASRAEALVFDGSYPKAPSIADAQVIVDQILTPRSREAASELAGLERQRGQEHPELEAGDLRRQRMNARVSQAQLAERMKVPTAEVRVWEEEGLPDDRRTEVSQVLGRARIGRKQAQLREELRQLGQLRREYDRFLNSGSVCAYVLTGFAN